MKTSNNRPNDVRQRILEEGIRLFAKNGFEGTSVKAVADAVGIKNSSLLYYFGSKEQLREEVIDDMLAHWKNELPRLISESTTSEDRFGSLVESVVNFFSEDKSRARLIVREMLDRPKEIGLRIREHLGPWTKLIADYINMGKKSGIINPGVVPEYYIIQVILMVAGTVTLSESASAITGEEKKSSMTITEGVALIARDILFVESFKNYLEKKSEKKSEQPKATRS